MDNSFEKRINELSFRTEQRCYANFTAFLTCEEKAFAASMACVKSSNCMFFGGFAEAERTILGFFPDYTENGQMSENFPIKLLQISGSGYRKLNHRDFLGSILSSGVKREFIGDIICSKDGYDGYVFVHESICDYILGTLDKVANDKVKVKLLSLTDLPYTEKDFKSIVDVVASLRLDGIVCGCINVSREQCNRLVAQGLVSVNHTVCTKKDKQISVGDLISIKGSGRFLLNESVLNKKGKYRIEILKYL